ncbi:ribosome assembly cofactor RimP [Flavobacterium piscinae]|uniref:Ribosome maturation factor RimP n=1 Tax=Flavobacterium piscinae TaxID=2506424 RepID=A0A4Q1KWK1_9FLAO|nr:ribosome assembly cofactor RimP [Flavobacterium piscinae]RXR34060.1 ribosome assembly cofactor RimP [Flavobacterium piscinae]
MTFKDKVIALLNQGLSEKPSVFLIDLTITESMKIIVTLDGDQGVTLQDCIDISRAIENNLDREEQDFSLEVASAGVSTPLKLVRQYKKNIGRVLKVKTITETIEAVLSEANEEFVTLTWTAREPKKIGKGKETVEKKLTLPYSEIKEAIVTITF